MLNLDTLSKCKCKYANEARAGQALPPFSGLSLLQVGQGPASDRPTLVMPLLTGLCHEPKAFPKHMRCVGLQLLQQSLMLMLSAQLLRTVLFFSILPVMHATVFCTLGNSMSLDRPKPKWVRVLQLAAFSTGRKLVESD